MGMNGSDFLLLANVGSEAAPSYSPVGCQRDCTVEEASDTIDFSCKDSRAQRVDYGRYSSTISLDSLYVPDSSSYLALKNANRDGEMILIAKEENDVVTETALAKVDTISESFPDQGESTVSISLTIDDFWEAVGS